MLPRRSTSQALPEFRRRLRLFALFVLVVVGILTYRLWVLQILQGKRYTVMSEHNRIRLERVPAVRGMVFDRKNRLLINSRPSFDVQFIPGDAAMQQVTLRRLAEMIEGDEQEFLQAVQRGKEAKRITLKRDVDWPSVVDIETHQLDLPGVYVSVRGQRSYATNGIMAHVLGYLKEINADQLRRLRKAGYRRGDEIGQRGLEKRWEQHLAGRSGGEKVEVDAMGRKVRVIDRMKATPGHNVVLTLDRELQQVAYDELKGKEGSVVVLKVDTGAVLALVNSPAFNPNEFARGLTPGEWRQITEHEDDPLVNRASQGQYPPGSTFKIVTALAALQEGVISPNKTLFCGGSYRVGNRTIRDWKKGGHGQINMHEALVQSCDVYFYQISQRLGIDKIARYARRFGLGTTTGIKLSESSGVVPDRAWKKRNIPGEPWYPGETPQVAIGQGFLSVTPLQMANMVAAVANGGTVYRPWFVSQVRSHNGEVMEQYGPVRTGTVGLKKVNLGIIRRALFDVVHGKQGTARGVRSDVIKIAGKTGTAQVAEMRGEAVKSKDLPYEVRDHAWFVAYAPAENPEIAVATLVEHGGHGGTVAGPITKRVIEAYFHLEKEGAEDSKPTNPQVSALVGGQPPQTSHAD